MVSTKVTLSDLFGNYCASARYSTFHHSIDTGSSALESCHCGGYVYHKWWHHLIIKHTWHMITGTNKIFQNPDAKTCSVILCVDMSLGVSPSHTLCDWYLNSSWSCIDSQCHLNCLSYLLLVYRFCNSFSSCQNHKATSLVAMGTLLNNRACDVSCLHMHALKWQVRFV